MPTRARGLKWWEYVMVALWLSVVIGFYGMLFEAGLEVVRHP